MRIQSAVSPNFKLQLLLHCPVSFLLKCNDCISQSQDESPENSILRHLCGVSLSEAGVLFNKAIWKNQVSLTGYSN